MPECRPGGQRMGNTPAAVMGASPRSRPTRRVRIDGRAAGPSWPCGMRAARGHAAGAEQSGLSHSVSELPDRAANLLVESAALVHDTSGAGASSASGWPPFAAAEAAGPPTQRIRKIEFRVSPGARFEQPVHARERKTGQTGDTARNRLLKESRATRTESALCAMNPENVCIWNSADPGEGTCAGI